MSTNAVLAPKTTIDTIASTMMTAIDDQNLDHDLAQVLDSIGSANVTADDFQYTSTLQDGLRALMRHSSFPRSQAWEDAIDYARAVIMAPRDDKSRALATWNRSCSDLSKDLLSRFGPDTIQAARDGCTSLVADHYGGEGHKIAHVDKKANFLRNWKDQTPGSAYYPPSSLLATAAYESGTLGCALTFLAWTSPQQAAKLGALAHLALCDDYNKFTVHEFEVRIRMIALSLGAAYELGGWAANALVDGSLLQSLGTGTDKSINSVMAWRAINGCTAPYTGAHFGVVGVEESLVSPTAMMAMHDLYDWRSDTAAGNHENGVSAVYGLGFNDPFHTYIEAVLEKAVKYPVPTVYTVSAMTFMHFTAARYGSYEYRGTHRAPCAKCTELLRLAATGAGLKWAPKSPPRSFAEGTEARKAAKAFIDLHGDQGLVQESASWMQHLINTGEIWFFDLLADGVEAVDTETGWA